MAQEEKAFTPGTFVDSWKAYDYHPHTRGVVWYGIFATILTGVVLWSIITDPQWGWFTSLAIILVAGVYCYVHKHGDTIQEVALYEYGFFVDQQFIPWNDIVGFWFVYDKTASVLHLQKKGKMDQSIALQMGDKVPEFFRTIFMSLGIPELIEKRESLVDLWIRVLKL